MTSAAYLRKWRKAHPGYHTQKTREYRAAKRRKKFVKILGINVRLAA